MAIKLFRVFMRGSYAASPQKLNELNVAVIPKNFSFLPMIGEDQGFGRFNGVVRKGGLGLPNYTVKLFKKNTDTVIYSTTTDSQGAFMFRNIKKGMECYLVAFPSAADLHKTNARIKTQLIAD